MQPGLALGPGRSLVPWLYKASRSAGVQRGSEHGSDKAGDRLDLCAPTSCGVEEEGCGVCGCPRDRRRAVRHAALRRAVVPDFQSCS